LRYESFKDDVRPIDDRLLSAKPRIFLISFMRDPNYVDCNYELSWRLPHL